MPKLFSAFQLLKGAITMSQELTEKTTLKLPVSSWWQLFLVVATFLTCYFNLQAMVQRTKEQSEKNAIDIVQTQSTMIEMKMDVKSIADDLKYFRLQYDRDMNKYIRETPGTSSFGK